MFLTHPSDVALLALAQHETAPSDQHALHAHLADCPRCRATVKGARELADMVRADWSPSATRSLLSRIEASRRAGVHVILPDADPVSTVVDTAVLSTRVVRGWYWGGLAAAASMTIALFAGRSGRPDTNAYRAPANGTAILGDERDETFETASAVFSALSPLPSVAQAQSVQSGNDRPIDTGIDGSTLAPGRWQYVTTQTVNGVVKTPPSTRLIVLERAMLAKRPVWRVVTTDSRQNAAIDTTLLDSRDLRPIERRWSVGSFKVRQEYGREQPDQIFTVATRTTTGTTARAMIDTMRLGMNVAGLMIETDAQLQLLFKLVRLDRGWQLKHGHAGGKVGPSMHSSPGGRTLQVVGEEVIQTSRESIPVWRVSYKGDARQTWYVSKANGDIVRVAGRWPGSKVESRTDLL
jgi:hypothetical protein